VTGMRDGVTAQESWRRGERPKNTRRQATLYRRRRIGFGVAGLVVCALIVVLLVAATSGGSSDKSQAFNVANNQAVNAPVAATGEAHPPFARLGDRNLLLPVAAESATIIAYQPVSDERAIGLTPIGSKQNSGRLARFFRRLFSGQSSVRYYVLDGPGSNPTSSVDIGAQAGSPVTSPVSGVIAGVKAYKLYGKYDDVQIDITPEGASGVTISLLLIADPVVNIGEVLTAGKTQLGKVRVCPSELGSRLSQFTHDAGAHIHMQATQEPID
jgi:hypothetical protein